MKPVHEPGQSVQRIKVGMTGLAIVLLLIALASAILRSASHERPVASPGASRAEALVTNAIDPAGEPLAEIGVAPAGQGNAAAPARGR